MKLTLIKQKSTYITEIESVSLTVTTNYDGHFWRFFVHQSDGGALLCENKDLLSEEKMDLSIKQNIHVWLKLMGLE